jgi:hypothetical protein
MQHPPITRFADWHASVFAVASLLMESSVRNLARSLIALHRADALRIAEQTAADQWKLGRNRDVWPAVIAEIKRIQKLA